MVNAVIQEVFQDYSGLLNVMMISVKRTSYREESYISKSRDVQLRRRNNKSYENLCKTSSQPWQILETQHSLPLSET